MNNIINNYVICKFISHHLDLSNKYTEYMCSNEYNIISTFYAYRNIKIQQFANFHGLMYTYNPTKDIIL